MKLTFPKIIYGFAKLSFILSLLLFLYIVFGVICFLIQEQGWFHFDFLNIGHTGSGQEVISMKLPFVDLVVSFPPSLYQMASMILFFALYSFYFYLMMRFFAIFSSNNSFSTSNLKAAKRFLWINIIPIILLIAYTIYKAISSGSAINLLDDGLILIFLHVFVIILVLLYQDIIKKGIVLQEQTDLTI